MEVLRCSDAADFLDRAGDLLLADEARHNLALGIASTLQQSPDYYAQAHFWVVVAGGEVVGAALRTPPHNLVVARPRDNAALEALAAGIEEVPPGVNGALPEAEDFARAWAAGRGGSWSRVMGQRIHALETVLPIARAPGAMRAADLGDRELALDWWRAFVAEAVGEGSPSEAETETAVEHRLAGGEGGIALWEDGGRPTSLAGFGGPTPTGIRIGPVYTPRELRGRGYATSLVAGLSAQLLAGGRRVCFLYTDLANPTANRIYARIGYRPVCDCALVTLHMP